MQEQFTRPCDLWSCLIIKHTMVVSPVVGAVSAPTILTPDCN